MITYDDHKIAELLQNDGVIKNKLKINAVVNNAHAYFKICGEFGSLDHYLWSFVEGKTIVNSWETVKQVPASTPLSDKISKDLKKRGVKFVGTTTIDKIVDLVIKKKRRDLK